MAVVKFEPTSENVIALSELPAIVATVPLKLPAKVPKEPADVLNDGAVEAVIILFVLYLRYRQDFLFLLYSYLMLKLRLLKVLLSL